MLTNESMFRRQFFHGTRADLAHGDLIAVGYTSNFGEGKPLSWVYCTAMLDAAIWGAELAAGVGRERIYLVKPSGPLVDDWVVIAADNPAAERGVHFSMPRPLRNRFADLHLEADIKDWCRWVVRAAVRLEIIAFLRFKPEELRLLVLVERRKEAARKLFIITGCLSAWLVPMSSFRR